MSPAPQKAAGAGAHRPEIDSLRAVAMTGVVAMHCQLLPMGWVGVWLFFVISGYVVTLSLLRNHDPDVPGSGLGHFFTQRAARILPAYYLYCGAMVLLALANGQSVGWPAWLSLLLFWHNVAMEMGLGEMGLAHVGHLWTLSVEMQFYLVYGVAACLLARRHLQRLLWAFLVLAPVARALAGWALRHDDPLQAAYIVYSAPGLHFDSFAMGCLLALRPASEASAHRRARLPLAAGGAIIAYAGVYLAVNVLLRHAHGIEAARNIFSGILIGEGREIALYSVLGLAFAALLHQALMRRRWLIPLIDWRMAHWVGRVSYGGYIYHPLCIALAMGALTAGESLKGAPLHLRLGVFLLAYALTLLVAGLSFRWLERPAARWIRAALGAPGARRQARAPRPLPTLSGPTSS